MKQIILLINILLVILFSACTNGTDLVINNEEETYPIQFVVIDPTLQMEGSPLRSTSQTRYLTSIELRVYNEDGDQIMNLYYYDKTDWQMVDGKAYISLSLPKGVYHFGFYTISSYSNTSSYYSSVDLQINKHNYFSYYYPYESTHNYYESITTTVEPTNQTIEQEITLKPMWSNLNLTIEDAQTFDAPEGTDALQFIVNPLYLGFSLKERIATQKAPNNFISVFSKYKSNTVSIDSIRSNSSFIYPTYVYQTLPENGNLAIKINYLKTKNVTDTIILKTRELQLPNITIENGYSYNIKGRLDSKKSGEEMNISLGEFNKEDVLIEF